MSWVYKLSLLINKFTQPSLASCSGHEVILVMFSKYTSLHTKNFKFPEIVTGDKIDNKF
jgi:hypothetical protein